MANDPAPLDLEIIGDEIPPECIDALAELILVNMEAEALEQ